MAQPAHSAAYFTDQRDFWFNADWLALMAERLRLHDVRFALDVGAGQGHWTLTLASLLAPEAEILGLEPEPRWRERAWERTRDSGLGDRVRFVGGEAEHLPFGDACFDLVTCQTVLIHLREAAVAVAEMARVLRPGGLILLSEPNNAAGMLVMESQQRGEPLERRLERIGFLLTCQLGKARLGEGDAAVPDLLPAMLQGAGMTDVRTHLNDRTDQLPAPYDRPAEEALRAAILEAGPDSWLGWSRTEAARWFTAGGGEPEGFAAIWRRRIHEAAESAAALRERRMSTAGGRIHYLISARRGT